MASSCSLPTAPRSNALAIHHMHRILIGVALKYYLKRQHRGVMVPCAYQKEKASGLIECGIAFFVGPDADSESPSDDPEHRRFDDRPGRRGHLSRHSGSLVRGAAVSGAPGDLAGTAAARTGSLGESVGTAYRIRFLVMVGVVIRRVGLLDQSSNQPVDVVRGKGLLEKGGMPQSQVFFGQGIGVVSGNEDLP